MKTKELPIFGIQANMLGVVTEDNTCQVLLANGKTLFIECTTVDEAYDIKTTLLYYPITEGRENNAHEFNFEFKLNYRD